MVRKTKVCISAKKKIFRIGRSKSHTNLLVLLQFRGDVEDVLLPGQRHRKRLAFDDAIQRVLLHFVFRADVDDGADLFNDVLFSKKNKGIHVKLVKAGIKSSYFRFESE